MARKPKTEAQPSPETEIIATSVEVWRSVPGFVGLYEVSSEGRVRSIARTTVTGVLGGRVLRPDVGRNRYRRVTLSANGRPHRYLLHRLVLLAFVGECPSGHECRHLDGDKSNCRAENLSWGSRSENARDRIVHGTQFDNRGERHWKAKLTDGQAGQIKALRQAGLSLNEIAAKFSVSPQTVSSISNGMGWSHV